MDKTWQQYLLDIVEYTTLTQREIAERIGIGESYLSLLISGERTPVDVSFSVGTAIKRMHRGAMRNKAYREKKAAAKAQQHA